jgi:hypothetical protein
MKRPPPWLVSALSASVEVMPWFSAQPPGARRSWMIWK